MYKKNIHGEITSPLKKPQKHNKKKDKQIKEKYVVVFCKTLVNYAGNGPKKLNGSHTVYRQGFPLHHLGNTNHFALNVPPKVNTFTHVALK